MADEKPKALHSSSDDVEGKLLKASRKVMRITNSNAGYLQGVHCVHVVNVINAAIRHAETASLKPALRGAVQEANDSGSAMGKIINAVNDYNDVVSDFIGVNGKRLLKNKARKILVASTEALYGAKDVIKQNPNYRSALVGKVAEAKAELQALIRERKNDS